MRRAPLLGLVKSLLFPGINLHTRQRYDLVPRQFGPEVSRGARVLDVGCGNGMLSYRAWQRGAAVVGLTIKESERRGCERHFNERKEIAKEGLSFRLQRLDELEGEQGSFDAVICADVLEHIRDDAGACRTIWGLLKPNGCVHVTVPNAEHPYNASFPLDRGETGGHVRAGYTAESLASLVVPLGFHVEAVFGFGGSIRQGFNWRIKAIQEHLGAGWGLPLFLIALPFLPLDSQPPRVPFSLYAKVRKPG